MTDTRKRSVHLPEFKAKVGLEAVRGVKTINEIAQDYGVHPVQVSQWKREIQDQAKTLFEGKRGPQPVSAHSAPDRLYGEIGRLKMELDWLKKSQRSAHRDTPVVDQWWWRVDAKAPVHACRCGHPSSSVHGASMLI
jgi:transposase-like protein